MVHNLHSSQCCAVGSFWLVCIIHYTGCIALSWPHARIYPKIQFLVFWQFWARKKCRLSQIVVAFLGIGSKRLGKWKQVSLNPSVSTTLSREATWSLWLGRSLYTSKSYKNQPCISFRPYAEEIINQRRQNSPKMGIGIAPSIGAHRDNLSKKGYTSWVSNNLFAATIIIVKYEVTKRSLTMPVTTNT